MICTLTNPEATDGRPTRRIGSAPRPVRGPPALECDSLPLSGVYQLTASDTSLPEPTMEIIERFRPELLKVIRAPLPGRASILSYELAQKTFGYRPKYSWHEA